MSRISVLQVGKYYRPYVGGTESHLSTLASGLKKEVNIKILAANTQLKTSLEKSDGMDIYRLASLGNVFSLPLTFTLPFWLARQKADILHFHLPNPISVFSYFVSRPKGKLIVSYHSDIIRQRFFALLFEPFLMRFLKKAEAIIVTSDELIRNSSVLNKFRDKCKIIPHGIDIDRFKPDEETLKKAEDLRQKYGNPLILFVGRLVYYKGLEYLLKAMKGIEAKLLLIGNGPLVKKLKRLSARFAVCDKIIWLGEVKDKELATYYYACDVFVLPSSVRAESFGIVQLEAFACGKPVVSTDLPTGVPFVNQHNKTGLVVPPGNAGALAGAINNLLASPELRKAYGSNAKARVEREFTREKMIREVLKIYEATV